VKVLANKSPMFILLSENGNFLPLSPSFLTHNATDQTPKKVGPWPDVPR